MRQKRSIIITIVLIGFLLISILLVGSASRETKKMHADVRHIVYEKLNEKEQVPILIKLKKAENINKPFYSRLFSKEDIETKLRRKKSFDKNKDIIYIRATREEIQELSNDDSIESIDYAFQFRKTLQDAVTIMNVTPSWNVVSSSTNITGISETVCIIDSGINASHQDLVGKNRTCVIDCFNKECIENCSVGDDDGHGTHLAGITSASGGIKGIAYDSTFIGLKVLNSSGSAHHSTGTTDIANAIDWCISNRDTYNISVILMSLGSTTLFSNYCDGTFPTT